MTDERYAELWNRGYADGLDNFYDDAECMTEEEVEVYAEGYMTAREDNESPFELEEPDLVQ